MRRRLVNNIGGLHNRTHPTRRGVRHFAASTTPTRTTTVYSSEQQQPPTQTSSLSNNTKYDPGTPPPKASPKNTRAPRPLSSSSSSSSAAAKATDEFLVSEDDDYAPAAEGELEALIARLASRRQTGVSLRGLVEAGSTHLAQLGRRVEDPRTARTPGSNSKPSPTTPVLKTVAAFLHHEMPIRLARRVSELDRLPSMRAMPSVRRVREWYAKSVAEIVASDKPVDDESEARFATLLEAIYERHAAVLFTMARGAHELRTHMRDQKNGRNVNGILPGDASRRQDREKNGRSSKSNLHSAKGGFSSSETDTADAAFESDAQIHGFLDSFYTSRIGIRMIIGQYLALRSCDPSRRECVGLLHTDVVPARVALAAVDQATALCERQFGVAPKVELHGRLDLSFAYVPDHLYYIMLELLKNSMRATVEQTVKLKHLRSHVDLNYADLPPIKVVVADGEANEDVALKVSDEGGGIPRSHMPRVWSYLFTTASHDVQRRGFDDAASGMASDFVGAPLAGLGYGLPISRAYARYFGGDVTLMSMEGFGTDAFVYLSRLGDHDEPLP